MVLVKLKLMIAFQLICVNYVTKVYGGRSSDKHITLDSTGLLDSLPSGPKVMVDRGFNVEDELWNKNVQPHVFL